MKNAAIVGLALLLALSLPAAGKDSAALTLSRGARIGIVSLLEPELTHYHSSKAIQDSFLKTLTVSWHVDTLFVDAVRERLTQMGLEPVPLAPSEGLERGRQHFFVDASVAKGLSSECADEFTRMAAANHVEAFVVLVPGANDSSHAGRARRKDLPDYLRGWGFVTYPQGSGTRPSVFNMTTVLLVSGTGGTALLRAREWGGAYDSDWTGYTPPADLKEIPDAQIDTLKPVFTDITARQSDRVLEHIEVIGQ